MEFLNKYIFIVIAEGLFLALVAAMVWLLKVRRDLLLQRALRARRESEIATLRQRLELSHQHLQAAKAQLTQLQNSQQQRQQDDQLLRNYQQRIANLEQFKQLYFEIEDRLAQTDQSDDRSEALQKLADAQNQTLSDLKAKLALVSKNYGMELDLTEELRDQLRKMEESAGALQENLDQAQRQRDQAKIDAQEADRHKERARKLEVEETRLQQALAAHTQRIQELESRSAANPAYGAVRVKEVEEMKTRLNQRESEIRRLRQECETIGIQYEELAAKSLAIAGDRGDLTDEQKAHVEELKKMLEANAAALALKQAECEILENYYLELEQNAELEDAAQRMQQSFVERDALLERRRDLSSQAMDTAGPEVAEELAKLRQSLAEREASLNEIRNDYIEIKEQFVQVAQEESELRGSYQMLKQEHEKLSSEVSELKQTQQELIQKKDELEKLRIEYTKMESRYLALVKKVQ